MIADPNGWSDWLTPLQGLAETVESPVAPGLSFGVRYRETMKSPPMMRPMMQAMTGLNTADEMTKTISRIKELSEQGS